MMWSYPQSGTQRAQAVVGLVTKPVTPRSQESRAPGEARVPLSPHPPRQEIDPRLEILIKTAIPTMGPSRPPGFARSVAAGRRPILHHPGPDKMVGLPRPRFKTACKQHPPFAQIGF